MQKKRETGCKIVRRSYWGLAQHSVKSVQTGLTGDAAD